MDLVSTLLLLILMLTDSICHLCLKAAARSVSSATGVHYWRRLFTSPVLWIGITTTVADFLLYVAFISRVPLGQGVLLGSVTIVGVMVGGRLLFGERITNARGVAITLIALGVVLIGWGHA
jgi:drug/metabolite transporter (DMT)-like permease